MDKVGWCHVNHCLSTFLKLMKRMNGKELGLELNAFSCLLSTASVETLDEF